MEVIYGKPIADSIKTKIKQELIEMTKTHRQPKLAVILVGNDPASQKYVANKQKACANVDILSEVITFENTVSEKTLINTIQMLNNDTSVDGILVQLPLPKHIAVSNVINAIAVDKDVDGFHPIHLGNLFSGNPTIIPCTPKGIMEYFKQVNYNLTSKNVVIIGRSTIVSKPLIALFLNADATVTITHSKTNNLKDITSKADVLVVAVGKANFITKDYIKENCFIIDVGINVNENGTLCGDVDFENVKDKVAYITPVPKGIGVTTIAMLLENTFTLYKKHIQKNQM